MAKNEIIAMLLAGGHGSLLGVLTDRAAKSAVAFGGKYRIIDFPLSNCINSGIDTVGVLTQYQPLRLNAHIGIGIPWDLDRMGGGVTILPPRSTIQGSDFYSGTANAVWQNVDYMDAYAPEYVLILPGDHVYKMDYEVMLEFHKASGADLTVACMPVKKEEAGRYHLAVTDDAGRILEFKQKGEEAAGSPASMGIFIFTYGKLKEILSEMKEIPALDFGDHVVPEMLRKNCAVYAYEFNDYWRDIGTLPAYWEANMDLAGMVPSFNLYDEHWKIYTKDEHFSPQYLDENALVSGSLIGPGSVIRGTVKGSVLSGNVYIGPGAVVEDSILMSGVRVERGAKLKKCIVAENSVIGEEAELGEGDFAESAFDPRVYNTDLVVVGEESVIPAGVIVGKNTAISGVTVTEDYPEGKLPSGQAVIREVAK